MTRVLFTLIAITVIFLAVGGGFFFFVWDTLFEDANIVRYDNLTTLGARVSEFQTLIGGFLAAFAALIAAISVYAAAVIPVWQDEKKFEIENTAKRQIGAALLEYSLSKYIRRLDATIITANDFANIDVPKELVDNELIGTQKPEFARHFVFTVSFANTIMLAGLHGYPIEMKPREFERQYKKLRRDLGNLVDDLRGITQGREYLPGRRGRPPNTD